MRDGELLVRGQLRHVCVDTGSWRKTELPEWIQGGLARFAVDGDG
ncbi:MAG TPA: hypothetical protein VGY13_12885 [Solirubrobacteraceae bacterium]|nr:hypothetical protein [Solirubrobacteraceae bacterium]